MAAEAAPAILASTSRYRRELLSRLRIAFECEAPDLDETRLPGEAPATMAARLARAKARAVAQRRPGAIVIGSDQVAELDGRALGKPGRHQSAVEQLRACSGRDVLFHTAACVVAADGAEIAFTDLTRVEFRVLGEDEIERYLQAEQPYDCAGSFKSEGLGACLFEAIHTRDPTALIGLPMIRLAAALRQCGLALP